MLAPIALQADGVVSQILIAATYPEQVAEAARWSRANPHLSGDVAARGAKRAMGSCGQDARRLSRSARAHGREPAVAARPGEAFLNQEVQVMDTVQALRQRAGRGPSLEQRPVRRVPAGRGDRGVPAQPLCLRELLRPVHGVRAVVVAVLPAGVLAALGAASGVRRARFLLHQTDWHHRHVQVVHKPVHVHNHHVSPGKWQPQKHVVVKPYVPGAGISAPADRAAAQHAGRKRLLEPETRIVPQSAPEPRGEVRGEPRQEVRGQPQREIRGDPGPRYAVSPGARFVLSRGMTHAPCP